MPACNAAHRSCQEARGSSGAIEADAEAYREDTGVCSHHESDEDFGLGKGGDHDGSLKPLHSFLSRPRGAIIRKGLSHPHGSLES